MATRPIIEVPDLLLRRVSTPVTAFDEALQTLVADMFETMYAAPGIGLAAIQIGVPQRVVVIDVGGAPREDGEASPDPRVFVNPELFDPSPEKSRYNEGCLSIPEQYGEVERPAAVSARWCDTDGVAHEGRFDGMLATCLQHEVDHLNGVLFVDHLSRLKRDMLLKRLAKERRAA